MKKTITLFLLSMCFMYSKAQVQLATNYHFLNMAKQDYKKYVDDISGISVNFGNISSKNLYYGAMLKTNTYSIDQVRYFNRLTESTNFKSLNTMKYKDISILAEIGYNIRIKENISLLSKIGFGAYTVNISDYVLTDRNDYVYFDYSKHTGKAYNASTTLNVELTKNVGYQLGMSYFSGFSEGTLQANSGPIKENIFQGKTFSFHIGAHINIGNSN